MCELLQRVVGDKVNIDDTLEASFAFLESIGQNTQLLVLVSLQLMVIMLIFDHSHIYELQDTLGRLTYDLARMGPPHIENQLLRNFLSFRLSDFRLKF